MNVPNDEIMKMMTRLAMERATEALAVMADDMADGAPSDISGPDALRAFASAIRTRNAQHYPKGSAQ